ncbi:MULTISPECIES: ATP-binding protein [Streptococcus]|uniref:ATP-binding protein n=1 Tax=Streptococcus caledonicus TaxID=2614158 RepID=A0ABW0UJC2_9STRE|nr:ATP-binding protein [Streptococcus sp. S784/96/1]
MRVTKLKENQIWAFYENMILLKNSSVFAFYEIKSMVANTMSLLEKEKLKVSVASVINDLHPFGDFEINDVPMTRDLIAIFEELSDRLDPKDVYRNLAETIFKKTLNEIYETSGVPFSYKHYLVVPLKSLHISVDLKSVVKQAYRDTKQTFMEGFGIYEDIDENWYEKYLPQRQVLESRLSLLHYKPLTIQETIFLNLLQYRRGLSLDVDSEIKQVQSSIENIDDVNITIENVNVMKLSNGDDETYIAHYPIGTLPRNISHIHIVERLKNLNFPVESKIKAKFVGTKGFWSIAGQTTRAQDKIKNAVSEDMEAGDSANQEQLDDFYLLNDLKDKINAKEKMLHYMHTLIVTGESIEVLKLKLDMLTATLEDVGVLKASADQIYLFYKNMFGETLEFWDKNFIQKVTVEGFCENLFFVSHKVGTDVGWYIGKVDNEVTSWFGDFRTALQSSNNLVLSDLLQANKLEVNGKVTNNPHVLITGDTGNGKSFAAKLIVVLHTLLKCKLLYIDPKDELKGQFLAVAQELEEQGLYPELVAYIRSINFVSLDPTKKENVGMLDPIVFLPKSEGKALAKSLVWTLSEKDDEKDTALSSALDKVYDEKEAGEQRGMLDVFEELANSDKERIQHFGSALLGNAHDSTLSVVFSRGEHKGISMRDKVTVIGIKNVELPSESSQIEMTDSERNGLVVLNAIGYFCKRFGSADIAEETITVMDEGWLFETSSTGKKILNDIKRLGRSQNNFLIVITQSVVDVNAEGDNTGFGTVFAFREENHVAEILDYIKVPNTEETYKWVDNMTMAQCIYYDTFGRKERITIDGGFFPELSKLFATVKVKEEKDTYSWEEVS